MRFQTSVQIQHRKHWSNVFVHEFELVLTYVIVGEQTNTYSNSTIETLEKGMEYVQTNNKDTGATSMTSFCHFIVNVEHISLPFLMFLLLIMSR